MGGKSYNLRMLFIGTNRRAALLGAVFCFSTVSAGALAPEPPATSPSGVAKPAAQPVKPKSAPKPSKAAQPPAEMSPLQKQIADLRSSDVSLRRQAVEELTRARDTRATPALILALSDADALVRAGAARCLGLMRSVDASKELARLVREDKEAMVRQAAAVSLNFLADPASADALIQALKDKEPGVRNAAAQALGSLRSSTAIPALTEGLKDTSPQYRRLAAQALGDIGDPAAISSLRPLLKDADMSVRAAAVQSLGQLQDSDKGTLNTFKDFLAPKFPTDLRLAAAHALNRQKVKEGQTAALAILSDKTAEPRHRVQAVKALEVWPDKSLLPVLKKLSVEEADAYVKPALDSLVSTLSILP